MKQARFCSHCEELINQERHVRYIAGGKEVCSVCIWLYSIVANNRFFADAHAEECQ